MNPIPIRLMVRCFNDRFFLIFAKVKTFQISNNFNVSVTILGIESSCDDTSAAIIRDEQLLSNLIASQAVHQKYGGVVPELASRAHQQNIIPVVDSAIKDAGIAANDIDAIAFTRGPGLMGSLLVGTSFAKGFALARDIPMIDINHLQGHVLALFIREAESGMQKAEKAGPNFPFICLLVSGGHTQLLVVRDHLDMEIIGQTIDDAAGEAFDKCGKLIGLPYPAGPVVDKLAKEGDPKAFQFSKPRLEGLQYSFSGLKTSFLYFLRDQLKEDENFIQKNLNNLCASLQYTIIEILADKLLKAVKKTGIKEVGIAGGVSANSGLKTRLTEIAKSEQWNLHIPKPSLTSDNAAMIAITGYYKYLRKEFAKQDIAPLARM